MSSFVPNWRHPVGQALMHAGSNPTVTRSTQSVHLAILPVLAENLGTSNGQPVSHRPQPMHCSGLTSTIPFSYCTIAPGAVHALILAHQPRHAAFELHLVEADQVPEIRVEGGHRLIAAQLVGRHRSQV